MGLLNLRLLTTALSPVCHAAFVLLALLHAPASAVEGGSLEYAVKATYLYKFADYVDWPAQAFASANSPLNLCIIGDDPFGAALDNAVRGQQVAGRPVVVHRLKNLVRDPICQILFVGGSDPQRAQYLAAVRGSNVLTVTDSQEAGGAAGIINFVLRDNRVRFDIDLQGAAQNGIGISSKLLKLAVNVRPLSPP